MNLLFTSKKKGVTLVEILVSIFLISTLSLLMAQLTSTSVKNYKVTQLTNKYSEDITKIIRDFEFTTRAGVEIESAGENQLIFHRFYNLENDSIYPDKVRYFIDNEDGNFKFKIGISESDGLDENKERKYKTESIKLIVSDVKMDTGDPLFKYYDKEDAEIRVDSVTRELPKKSGIYIQSVQLKISLGGNPVDPLKITTQTTKIKFRNLNAI